MTKPITKAELEKMLHASGIALKEKIMQIKDLKSEISMYGHKLKQANLIVADNDNKHKQALEKRDDYVKRVLARIEGVKALLHVPMDTWSANNMGDPTIEALQAEWNKEPFTRDSIKRGY